MIIRDNFCEFCTKSYVVTPHLICLDETVQLTGHDIIVSKRNKTKYPSIIIKYSSYL